MATDVEQLYRDYGPMVLRRCRALLRDEQAAVEAMQDTFVQILRRADSLDVSAPSSLLYTTATNVCLNRIRRKRRRPEDANDDLVARIANSTSPEDGLLARLTLGRLFADQRASTQTIAVLHLRDGLTLQEVADTVGLSVSGVRKRLRTLRGQVRELEGLA
ncbi:MAG: sigma-70 family RNA polymerase sigma factor [Alphaproteobacteria bacterium]|nr:sigma-70 family RNA polymerase sigma factor [Alphaproteobacteria bacterium]